MKKHRGAIAPHQVVEIPKESKATNIENNCYVKAATVLGVVQIICGIVALAIWILVQDNNTISFGKSIWTFTLFFFSGVLTIRVVESRNRWLAVASMVMSINSAVSAGFFLINASIFHGECEDVVKVVMAGQMLMASTASVFLTAFNHLPPTSASTSTSTSTSTLTYTLGQPKLHESGRLVHSTILLSLISLKLMTAVKTSTPTSMKLGP